MGVYGLTTYLRDKKRLLSTSIELTASSSTKNPTSIVVDGWSFIYDVHDHSNLPWVYGGEYSEFANLVTAVVEAWIKVGLKIYIVFDGAHPELKFPTIISRLSESHVRPSLLFFRTSPAARATSRSLHETCIIPPLLYETCINALENLRSTNDALELHFADEEGDPYAVELAGRVGGYVVGNDSDFVILHTEGYLGYIPLAEMTWQASGLDDIPTLEDEDAEFQTVRKKSKRRPTNSSTAGKGLLPPDTDEELILSFITYNPVTLADHFKLPVTLLPLLGAFVGNDYSKQTESHRRNIQSLFFDKKLSSSQRIDHTAAVMRAVLSPATPKRKSAHPVGSPMDLIDRTVTALLSRLTNALGSGEIDSIIEKVVEATLRYALLKYSGDIPGKDGLWRSGICALHPPESCRILPMFSQKVITQHQDSGQEDASLFAIREKYLQSYRSGLFSPKNMDVLSTGTFWPRLFLENPDLETVGRSIGRPIHIWVYAILNDAVGLPDDIDDEDEDEDELIDVVESDGEGTDGADYLAPLKGELRRLHTSEDEATEPPAFIASSGRPNRSRPAVVTEYLRRGVRIAEELVEVVPLHDLLPGISLSSFASIDAPPLLLRSQDDRLTVFLRAVDCDIPSIRGLSSQHLVPVLAVRWIARTLSRRAQETGSKEHAKEKWTMNEARCFLASFAWSTARESDNQREPPPIVDRHVQLMAQYLMALETISQLSEVLLLTERAPSTAHLFSGKLCHEFLTQTHPLEDAVISSSLWAVATEGLSDDYQEERPKKAKKTKKERGPALPSSAKPTTGTSLFALLGDQEA